MSSPRPDHDTLVHRLTRVLVKLNRGERLDPRSLAAEFDVDLRTVQRDLNQRFAYLDLIKVDGKYQIDPAMLGQLSTRDIARFAAVAGTQGLFPALSHAFVRQLLREEDDSGLLVRGHNYEDIDDHAESFALIRRAIADRRRLAFEFSAITSPTPRFFCGVEPYKLLNQKGIWYLVAIDSGKLKIFGFTRLRALQIENGHFEPDAQVESRLESDDGLWQSETSTRVVLHVASSAAPYFQRRDLVANQRIEAVQPDGSLLVSTRIGHPNQIVPIVRYWIPHLRIVEPAHLQLELELELASYLGLRAPETTPPVATPS
ncbi:WYL domain-containing protein [Variovorax humicola]|uniref:WYL domain-containing protein n=1 Tax=Variovorax humicola TaxID=1769758 RepID=A0ABU8W9F9_9BURK